MKTSVYPNSTVRFFATDLYPSSYEPVYEETFDCTLASSVSFFATSCPVGSAIDSLATLMQQLDAGSTVRFVAEYSACAMAIARALLPPITDPAIDTEGDELQSFEYFNDRRIAAQPFVAWNTNRLVRLPQPSPLGVKYATVLVEYKLWSNGSLPAVVTLLDARNVSVPLSVSLFECALGPAFSLYALPDSS